MAKIEFDDFRFKENFSIVSKNRIKNFVSSLIELFDSNQYHYCRATMHRFYFKYPCVHFDKSVAESVLYKFFEDGHFFIIDKSNLNYTPCFPTLITDTLTINELNEANNNWFDFLSILKSVYISDIADKLNNIDFYKSRRPRNLREKIIASEINLLTDEINKPISYPYFNIKQIMEYFYSLIGLYFPEYNFIDKLSTRKLKRYAKVINEEISMGFSVDIQLLETELKLGYLEVPFFKIELYSTKFIHLNSKVIDPFEDLDEKILSANVFYFMGNFIHNRIGKLSDSNKDLSTNLHFHFGVTSFYTKIYLEEIASIIKSVH